MRELARMVRVCGTALSELRACPLSVGYPTWEAVFLPLLWIRTQS